MKLNELAKRVGKSVPYVMTLQKKFGLPVCKDYPVGYAVLVEKLIYLSICSVPDKEIKSLLSKEKKLLELLKVDSLHDGGLWFESMCVMKSGPQRLLLSGYDLGHPVDCPIVQTGLDSSDREKELFQSSEMGASALKELQRYSEIFNTVKVRIEQELSTVDDALKWSLKICSMSRHS
ncbi:hypothetical protein PDESU_06166 [Pontiella desulfatans]|uniref:Uncharacterized protein n=1 Tax=Pontiella desulfatans TaxID=2750659 RepID=A0A6C2UBN0_PONDE|nr:hypothetical protein [Pontiella desulfatans]VGO17568.1 hypothetical protein PDESU_06166 [Pontiella desulfatans]